MDKTLVVIRGAKHTTDPTFACVAHDTTPDHYVALDVEAGRVVGRQLYRSSQRRELERRMHDDAYRGVFVDTRKDRSLLSLTPPEHALEADLAQFRRAKSDDELQALRTLSAKTAALLGADAEAFRGAASTEGLKSAYKVTQAKGFTQYRGGFQDALGRCSELTRVEAKTPEWEGRLARVYRGLDAVRDRCLQAGVTEQECNDTFLRHLDSDKDYVYGSVLHHTGFESYESSVPLGKLQAYDYVTLGTLVGDGKETAYVFRSAHSIEPPLRAPSPPSSPPTFVEEAGRVVEDVHRGVKEDEQVVEQDVHRDMAQTPTPPSSLPLPLLPEIEDAVERACRQMLGR